MQAATELSANESADDSQVLESRRRVSSVLQRAVLAVPVLIAVVAGWLHRWTFDDGFIYFRVVDQIRSGNGPVFNVGERVEVATGTLWLAILTVADVFSPLRLEWTAVVLGIAGTASGIALATAGAYRIARVSTPESRWFVPFGSMVFVAVTATWIWTTSGLETGLTVAWLGASWWLLVRWSLSAAGAVSVPAAAVLGAGWLIRPDLVLFSAAFLVLLVSVRWAKGYRRNAVAIAAAMMALPVIYQVFRMGYYGLLVPNTALAKEGASSNWGRGWRYLRDFVDPYWLWFPIAVLAIGGYLPLVSALMRAQRHRSLAVIAVFVGCALIHGVYVMRVGGDYLHGRFFIPSMFALCAPVAAVAVNRRHLLALSLIPWLVVSFVMLRPAQYENWIVGEVVLPQGAGLVTLEDSGWSADEGRAEWYSGPGYYRQISFGTWVREADVTLKPDVAPSVGAFGGIGAVGYYLGSEFYIFDALGLAEVITSHFEAITETTELRLAGHEKKAPPAWIAAQVADESSTLRSSAFEVSPRSDAPIMDDDEFTTEVEWARRALSCEPIRKLMDSTRAPLSARRFIDNLRDAFANTRLRIPLEPEQAVQTHCERKSR